MSNAIVALIAAVTSGALAALDAPPGDNTPYLLCLAGVLAGTFGRVGYWADKDGWKRQIIIADVTSIPVLYVLAIGTAAYMHLPPPIAAAVSGMGSLIGIEIFRNLALSLLRKHAGAPNPPAKEEANDVA